MTEADRNGLDRRALLGTSLAALAAGTPRGARAARASLRDAAREAWSFTLPLVEIARVRHRRAHDIGLNRLRTSTRLLDHTARSVTTPNNDTLYGTAQLDLSVGPAILTVPRAGDRYLSVALMDAYSDNFAVLGARTTPMGGTFRIGGPSTPGPVDLRAPTDHVWCLARTLVTGPQDVPAALAVASRVRLEAPPAAAPPPVPPDRGAPWDSYFAGARRLLALNPPPARDQAHVARLSAFLGPDAAPAQFSPSEAAEIEAGVADARRAARAGFTGGRYRDGWSYAKANIGAFGTDYAYRAAVALSGLAALPAEEALYMQAEGTGAGVFAAGTTGRLHFPAGRAPPVDGFWSLSLYEATDEGQYYFAANPLGRYAIGDRTPGLQWGADGSLDIWIGAQDPGPDRRSNWLPAPAGRFALILRTYLPSAALRQGDYRLPPVEQL